MTGRAPSRGQLGRVIIAGSIGNALEWFDLIVYGFFAATLSRQFFPTADPTVSLMLALGTFGVSYLVRPLGAVVLGAYADRAGRKASLSLSILLMMIGTAVIAVMPPYAAIGLWAPLGILLSRLAQGFSVGGEFGSSTALLVETDPRRRGFMASWQYSSQGFSTLLAAAAGALTSSLLAPAQLESWGWRLPFLFGLLLGPIGFYIRRHIEEGPEFTPAPGARSPLADLIGSQKLRLVLATGTMIISTCLTYMILYMPTYAVKQLGMPASISFAATVAAGAILTVMPPFIGHWSDRIGRLRLMAAAAIALLLSAYPAFLILHRQANTTTLFAVLIWFSLVKACYSGVSPALMAEMFPTRTRATGLAISNNLGVTLFGGFAPLVITALIDLTGSPLAPSFYLIFCAVAGIITLVGTHSILRLR